ncbi:capsid protein [Lactobacillus gallinarum]|uniref:capsid protein n=1 Tax=Lactobacillus gallinarum TaxID=52242 RepID=UPI0024B0A7E6|nr:capsid protein [Lactobacillus gallinarum]
MIAIGLIIMVWGIAYVFYAFWYDKSKLKPEDVKEGMKPLHKRFTTWLMAVILTVGGFILLCAGIGNNNDADNSSAKTEQVKKSKPKKAKKTSSATQKKTETSKPKKTAPKKKPTVSTADKEAAALVLLKKSYKGQAKVWFDADNKAFMIQPTSENFKEELLDVVQSQDTDYWKQLTDSIDAVSRSLYKNVKLADFVSIVNPDNPDKVLYSSLNGKTAYDFLKDDE